MLMLEGMSPECVNHFLSRNSALMVDAMALLPSLTIIPKTFGELPAHVLSRLLSLAGFHKASRIDFVADRYPDHSIKDNERSTRAAQGSTLVNIQLIQLRLSKENCQTLTSKREKHYYYEIVHAYMLAHLCYIK